MKQLKHVKSPVRQRTAATPPGARAPDPLRPPPAAPAPILPSEAEMEAAAAAKTLAEGQRRAREAQTAQMVATLAPVVSGMAAGDLEMALCALATVTGQVMAATGNPPGALAYVVRIANQTVQQMIADQIAYAAAQQAA